MTPLTVAILALIIFVAGLCLGHRWGSHDSRIEARQHKRRADRILGFATPYIEANASRSGWSIERDAGGRIIDLHEFPTRCGTPALLAKELLAERARRRSLH